MGLHVAVFKIGECVLTDSQYEEMQDKGELRPHFEDSEEYMYFMFNQEFSGERLESGWYKAVCLACKSMGSYSRFREFRQRLARIDYIHSLSIGYINPTNLNNSVLLEDAPDHYLAEILEGKSNPLYHFMSVKDYEGVLTASECKTSLAQFKKIEGIMSKQTDKNLLESFKTWVELLELAVDNDGSFIALK